MKTEAITPNDVDPELATPAEPAATAPATTTPVIPKYCQVPGYGPLRTVVINNRLFGEIHDVAKITGLPIAEITGLPRFAPRELVGMGSIFCWETFRTLKGTDGVDYQFVDIEILLPLCKTVRGADFLIRYLLQRVLPPDSDARPLVFDDQADSDQFSTAAGQFVSQRFYNDTVGEIRAIVTGATARLCAGSIARIMRVPVRMVVQLAGAGNSLTIQSKYFLTPIKPGSPEVYIRPEAATRVMRASASLVSLAGDVEKWIRDELLFSTKLYDTGGVVSLRGLHGVLDRAADFADWLSALVGPTLAASCLDLDCFMVPITLAKGWVKKSNYRSWVVGLLLQDGGVCHGGRVGETADEALVRIQPVFPDENGQVSARALYAFLGSKRTLEAWLDVHSVRAGLGQAATKSSSRVRGDVLLSEEQALALLLQSIKDPADFRTTFTPSTKL